MASCQSGVVEDYIIACECTADRMASGQDGVVEDGSNVGKGAGAGVGW